MPASVPNFRHADIASPLATLFYLAMWINVVLAVFNLIPLPPLDGSHVIRHFLSYNALRVYDRIGYGGLIVIMFILPMMGISIIGVLIAPFHGILSSAAEPVPEILMPDTNRTNKGRILSGMRPTGKLHLGNYVGALRNWVGLQDKYECFFFIADWHALTTDYADTRMVKQNSLEVMLDYLAAGLDPERSTLFIQSHVPQHAELHLLFSMITPLELAGARAQLQRAAREHQGQGPRDLRISRISAAAVGGHS